MNTLYFKIVESGKIWFFELPFFEVTSKREAKERIIRIQCTELEHNIACYIKNVMSDYGKCEYRSGITTKQNNPYITITIPDERVMVDTMHTISGDGYHGLGLYIKPE